MKQFSSLMLALGLSAACAMGQNVTVFMKDNTTHKFNAEYLSEIKFRDVTPSPDEIQFKTIDLDLFGSGNVTVTLQDEAETVKCIADLYGSTDAVFLQPGIYEVASTSAPFTVNPGYSRVTVDGEASNIVSGSVTVEQESLPTSSMLREAPQEFRYQITVDFTLDNGKKFKGLYVGTLPFYSPWINVPLSGASYNTNPQPKGTFYVKFHDADWNYDMAMVFKADDNATLLPAGTYTLSDFATPGSLLSASWVDTFKPNSNAKLLAGSKVIVEENNGAYDITMDLELSDGRSAIFTYSGEISGTPVFEDPQTEGDEYPLAVAEPYGAGNTTIYLYDTADMADYTKTISLDCYGTSTAAYFEPGVYTIGGDQEPYVDLYPGYTFYSVKSDDGTVTTKGLKSGTLTVTLAGNIYTLVLDAVVDDGASTPLKAWYKGKLSGFGPDIDIELTSASYNSNKRPTGNFYVKFNNSDWSCDMALDMFADPSATLLPAGTYIYSTEKTRGTFSELSYVDLTTPISTSNRMKEGSVVTVTVDENGVYHFDMDLKFVDGREATITYNGQISGEPVFDNPVPEGDEYPLAVAEPYGAGNTTIYLYNTADMADYTKTISLDCYGTSTAAYFEPGVYTIGGDQKPFVDLDPGYTFYSVKSDDGTVTTKGLKSGTLTVTLAGNIYTLVLDAVVDDDASTPLKAWYKGKLSGFGPDIDIELTSASYNSNKRPTGNFYVKFNNSDWSCDMALDMFADRSATLLPAGTYTYSTEKTPGTFSELSYVDLMKPTTTSNRMKEGSVVTVTVDENGVYHFDMDLKFVDGREATITYNGQISGEPVFDNPVATVLDCSLHQVKNWGQGNVTLYFYSQDESVKVDLDCYISSDATFLETGEYVIGGSQRPYIDKDPYYTFTMMGEDKKNLKSGTLKVTRDGAMYTFVLDAELTDGTLVTMNTTDRVTEFGPELEVTLSSAKYLTNPRPAGNIYIKFNDEAYNCEMALDIWEDPSETTLVPGEYTFKSVAGTPFTFSSDSYVNLYNPSTTNRMVDGSTVTIEENGSHFKINMHLLFEDGRIADIYFNGPISGTPVFE